MITVSDNGPDAELRRNDAEVLAMKRTMAAALLALGACGLAQAGDYYVAGDITKTRFSGLGNDQGFSLSGGYKFNENWAAELGYRFIGSDTQTFVDGANKWTLSGRQQKNV